MLDYLININKRLLFFVVLAVCFGWGNIVLAGFGISPPTVKNNHLIPGSSYEQQINLLRSSAEEDMQALVEIEAPEIQDWLKIDKGDKFTLPKGELRVPMKVKVTVPKNAEVGGYQGHINIKVTSLNQSGPGVAVALGARVDIDLTLTNEEFSEFIVRSVNIPDFEILPWPFNSWPLKWFFYRTKVGMRIENMGNIKVSPTKVLLDVYDISEKNLLESSYDKKIDKIDPYSTEEVNATFPTNLPPGQYWGKVKIYKGEQIVNTYKLTYTIHPEGTLENNGLGKWPYILIGITVLVAIILIALFFKLRVWMLFVMLFSGLLAVLRIILKPFASIGGKVNSKAREKFWSWIIKKAKEKERDAGDDPPGKEK